MTNYITFKKDMLTKPGIKKEYKRLKPRYDGIGRKIKRRQIDSLDALFSEFIRKRAIKEAGGCERCLTPKYDKTKDDGDVFPAWMSLQCSHFWGRRKQSVRFDEDNAAGLCGACHMYFTANPEEHRAWFINKRGLLPFELLVARANRPQKVDKELLTIYFQERLKILTETP